MDTSNYVDIPIDRNKQKIYSLYIMKTFYILHRNTDNGYLICKIELAFL